MIQPREKGILRIPTMPISKIENVSYENILEIITSNELLESLFIASPNLYDQLIKLIHNKIEDPNTARKLKETTYKYLSRASSRCTPFGLFSTCSFIEIQRDDISPKITLENHDVVKKNGFDTFFIFKLVDYLLRNQDIKYNIKYFANNSIYSFADQKRYLESVDLFQNAGFQLSSVQHSEYLEVILEKVKKGASIPLIVESLIKFDSELSDIETLDFVNEIIKEKILVSELEPLMTSSNYLNEIINTLSKWQEPIKQKIVKELEFLNYLKISLKKLENNLEPLNTYEKIIKSIRGEGIEIERKDIFKVDANRKIKQKFSIPNDLISELQDSIEILSGLANKQNDSFSEFKNKFESKYGDKKIPLLEALDPESGIGYITNTETNIENSLLKDISFSRISLTKKIVLTDNFLVLRDKLLESYTENKNVIELTTDILKNLKEENLLNEEFSVSVSQYIEEGQSKLLINNVSNVNAAYLFSRFTHLDKEIHSFCRELINKQSRQNSIIAEIIHIPEAKAGNLVCHDNISEYDLPIVTRSNKQDKNQINLADIVVYIDRNNNLRLISKKLNKEIIPNLLSAYNIVRNSSCDIYRFLCDLQFQNQNSGFAFPWGELTNLFSYFPRVQYKRIILSPESWKVSITEFKYSQDTVKNYEIINDWRSKNNVPKRVFLSRSMLDDQKLVIDFNQDICLNIFIDNMKKYKELFISEIILNKESIVQNKKGEAFNNEILLSIKNQTKKRGTNIPPIETHQIKKRNSLCSKFAPGSEWLFFKVYCGPKVADKILLEIILPFCDYLINQKIISKWFFIRYSDPDYHIRLRFLLIRKDVHLALIMNEWNERISTFLNDEIVNKVVIDTYIRELGRYGISNIEKSEQLFWKDSEFTCRFLKSILQTESQNDRWIFAIYGVDMYMENFGLTLLEKYDFMSMLSRLFENEFNVLKKQRRELDLKFRNNRKIIENIFEGNYFPFLENNSVNLSNVIMDIKNSFYGKKDLSKNDLLMSYIHMFINRIFMTEHRKNEFVIYYMMTKYYKSKIARIA